MVICDSEMLPCPVERDSEHWRLMNNTETPNKWKKLAFFIPERITI